MNTVWVLSMAYTLAGPGIRSQEECVAMAEILIKATQFVKGYTVHCDWRSTEPPEPAVPGRLSNSSTNPGVILMLPSEPEPDAGIPAQQEKSTSPLSDALQELAKKLRVKGARP